MVIGGTTNVQGEMFDFTNENTVCESTSPFERWAAVTAMVGSHPHIHCHQSYCLKDSTFLDFPQTGLTNCPRPNA